MDVVFFLAAQLLVVAAMPMIRAPPGVIAPPPHLRGVTPSYAAPAVSAASDSSGIKNVLGGDVQASLLQTAIRVIQGPVVAAAIQAQSTGAASITNDKEQYSSVLGGAPHRPSMVPRQFAPGTSEEDITNMHRAQERMTTILATVDRIARLHNISYWMCGGSLIGAMRDGGWVPWDHDIDIGMQDKDFARFQQFARAELGEGMWLQDWDSDPHYPTWMNKSKAYVRDLHCFYGDGTCQAETWHNGLMVDIFLSGGKTGCGGFGYSATCCDPSLALPTVDVPFGTHTFAAPSKWQSALQQEYGADWVIQPPVAKRSVWQSTNVTCGWLKAMYPDLYAQA